MRVKKGPPNNDVSAALFMPLNIILRQSVRMKTLRFRISRSAPLATRAQSRKPIVQIVRGASVAV
ncbi:MAG: hypothetical protein J2P21_01780 [Chloracidobacterium sp.]|nr:hypothetical protein [Chloracidobacterium sp.]